MTITTITFTLPIWLNWNVKPLIKTFCLSIKFLVRIFCVPTPLIALICAVVAISMLAIVGCNVQVDVLVTMTSLGEKTSLPVPVKTKQIFPS